MIILDTNIISELMRSNPDASVLKWIDGQNTEQLFVTTISIAEISYGLNSLSSGKRRISLEMAFNNVISDAFSHRILFFDEAASHAYGKMMAHRKSQGKPLSILDGQIAAITSCQQGLLATRNIRDFLGCKIELINPFDS